jgi:cell division control protein 6
MVGSSQSISGPSFTLNTIVAETLSEIADELEKASQETVIPCHVIHLNCEVIDTQYRVLAQIAKNLEDHDERPSDGTRGTIPFTGWPTDQVYMELKNLLESVGGVHGDRAR